MKKIFFALLFAITIVKASYSQTLHHSKYKHLKAKNFCKVETDTCSSVPGNTIALLCDDIQKRNEPTLRGILFIYPPCDEINKWMLVWSRAFKGISIPY